VDATPSDTGLHCTQCGGELHPDEGQLFLTCPYCGATVYLDKSQVVFHWYLAPTLDEAQARASLARWMAGSQTVKDLDKKARLTGSAFEYFPLWYFKLGLARGREEIALQPAAATSVSELLHLNLPAGDLRKVDPSIEAQAQAPNVPLQTALEWVAVRQGTQYQVLERALVHIPVYTFKYSYNGNTYTALVEAATGGVFANLYPAKAEAPFRLVGGITAVVFLCLATFPVIGALSDRSGGLGVGALVCLGGGALAGPVLLALAAWVAAKT
jgi:hypothetical protein